MAIEVSIAKMRVGTGFDLHRIGVDRPLMLGGVEIRPDGGLVGHSDADCVLHAVADALLGAAALGDIGQHFPDTDPAYRDADSGDLLRRIVSLVEANGYRIVNVDCTVLAERPKLSPHRDAMRQRMAELLGTDAGAVGMKFTTLEGLGALGRGEGIACLAICLLDESEGSA